MKFCFRSSLKSTLVATVACRFQLCYPDVEQLEDLLERREMQRLETYSMGPIRDGVSLITNLHVLDGDEFLNKRSEYINSRL